MRILNCMVRDAAVVLSARSTSAVRLPEMPSRYFLDETLAKNLLDRQFPWGDTGKTLFTDMFLDREHRWEPRTKEQIIASIEARFLEPETDTHLVSVFIKECLVTGLLTRNSAAHAARSGMGANLGGNRRSCFNGEEQFLLNDDPEVISFLDRYHYSQQAAALAGREFSPEKARECLREVFRRFGSTAESWRKYRHEFLRFFSSPHTQSEFFLAESLYPEGATLFTHSVRSFLTRVLNDALEAGLIYQLSGDEMRGFPDFAPRYRLSPQFTHSKR